MKRNQAKTEETEAKPVTRSLRKSTIAASEAAAKTPTKTPRKSTVATPKKTTATPKKAAETTTVATRAKKTPAAKPEPTKSTPSKTVKDDTKKSVTKKATVTPSRRSTRLSGLKGDEQDLPKKVTAALEPIEEKPDPSSKRRSLLGQFDTTEKGKSAVKEDKPKRTRATKAEKDVENDSSPEKVTPEKRKSPRSNSKQDETTPPKSRKTTKVSSPVKQETEPEDISKGRNTRKSRSTEGKVTEEKVISPNRKSPRKKSLQENEEVPSMSNGSEEPNLVDIPEKKSSPKKTRSAKTDKEDSSNEKTSSPENKLGKRKSPRGSPKEDEASPPKSQKRQDSPKKSVKESTEIKSIVDKESVEEKENTPKKSTRKSPRGSQMQEESNEKSPVKRDRKNLKGEQTKELAPRKSPRQSHSETEEPKKGKPLTPKKIAKPEQEETSVEKDVKNSPKETLPMRKSPRQSRADKKTESEPNSANQETEKIDTKDDKIEKDKPIEIEPTEKNEVIENVSPKRGKSITPKKSPKLEKEPSDEKDAEKSESPKEASIAKSPRQSRADKKAESEPIVEQSSQETKTEEITIENAKISVDKQKSEVQPTETEKLVNDETKIGRKSINYFLPLSPKTSPKQEIPSDDLTKSDSPKETISPSLIDKQEETVTVEQVSTQEVKSEESNEEIDAKDVKTLPIEKPTEVKQPEIKNISPLKEIKLEEKLDTSENNENIKETIEIQNNVQNGLLDTTIIEPIENNAVETEVIEKTKNVDSKENVDDSIISPDDFLADSELEEDIAFNLDTTFKPDDSILSPDSPAFENIPEPKINEIIESNEEPCDPRGIRPEKINEPEISDLESKEIPETQSSSKDMISLLDEELQNDETSQPLKQNGIKNEFDTSNPGANDVSDSCDSGVAESPAPENNCNASEQNQLSEEIMENPSLNGFNKNATDSDEEVLLEAEGKEGDDTILMSSSGESDNEDDELDKDSDTDSIFKGKILEDKLEKKSIKDLITKSENEETSTESRKCKADDEIEQSSPKKAKIDLLPSTSDDKWKHRVSLCNLPKNSTHEDIRNVFATVGVTDIVEIHIIASKRAKSKSVRAIMSFMSEESLLKAVSSYGQISIKERPIYMLLDHAMPNFDVENDNVPVKKQNQTKTKNLVKTVPNRYIVNISKVPNSASANDILNSLACRGISSVTRITLHRPTCKNGYLKGFIKFSKLKDLNRTIKKADKIKVNGHTITVKVKDEVLAIIKARKKAQEEANKPKTQAS